MLQIARSGAGPSLCTMSSAPRSPAAFRRHEPACLFLCLFTGSRWCSVLQRASSSAAGWPYGPEEGSINLVSPAFKPVVSRAPRQFVPGGEQSKSTMRPPRQCDGLSPPTPVSLKRLQHASLRRPARLATCIYFWGYIRGELVRCPLSPAKTIVRASFGLPSCSA